MTDDEMRHMCVHSFYQYTNSSSENEEEQKIKVFKVFGELSFFSEKYNTTMCYPTGHLKGYIDVPGLSSCGHLKDCITMSVTLCSCGHLKECITKSVNLWAL